MPPKKHMRGYFIDSPDSLTDIRRRNSERKENTNDIPLKIVKDSPGYRRYRKAAVGALSHPRVQTREIDP